ncbi:hypothetical protein [Rhizorhabdus sp. FW153]|uniref:hypothetical protein n=1 Tax=Rhizorhabdus sp. FW153 TaxID=3400216 RepID=UPI003CF2CB05
MTRPQPLPTLKEMHQHSYALRRISSEIALPDLPAWDGAGESDLVIRLGAAPSLHDVVARTQALQVALDGHCRLHVGGTAAWTIAPDGRTITIEPETNPDDPAIRTYLYGTVFAIAAMRWGLFPLHSACLRFGNGVVAFSGRSGAGKSTLAAMLIDRGRAMLADDVTLLDLSEDGAPVALPSFPRVKLWQDALDRMQIDATGLERVTGDVEKFKLPVAEAFHAQPLPLHAIVMIDPDTAHDGRLTRLRPTDLLPWSKDLIYRPGAMRRMGLTQWQMQHMMRLLSVPAYRIGRVAGPDQLDGLVAQLDDACT